MRILVHGRFYPGIGGIETIVRLLATEWTAAGHEVVVVSNLGGQTAKKFPFDVVYRPGPIIWFRLVKWSQVVLHMNLSLKGLWPQAWLKRRLIVSHQSFYTTYRSSSTNRTWPEKLKLRVLPRATSITASNAIAAALKVSSRTIPNPYEAALFRQIPGAARDRELVFVGRLVSEKGADLLLQAFKQLEKRWPTIRLSLIGHGPERPKLEKQAAQMGLAERTGFLGPLEPEQVAAQLRRHRILVVPSVYEEPFGVVALEGAACGCRVLGSDGGGLPEAIGPAGTTFRRGNLADLTERLNDLLGAVHDATEQQTIAAHLQHHHPRRIAEEYLKVFRGEAPREQRPHTGEIRAFRCHAGLKKKV